MATYKAKEFTLKDHSKVTIASAQIEDAQGMLDMLDALTINGEGMILAPGELEISLEDEQKIVKEYIENSLGVFLLAKVDGKIAGSLNIKTAPRKRMAHKATFGMGLVPGHKSNGLGSLLLGEAIKWAKATDKIEKIQLNVLASNSKAIGLYKKFGFQTVGTFKKEFKFEGGTYEDDQVMELDIS